MSSIPVASPPSQSPQAPTRPVRRESIERFVFDRIAEAQNALWRAELLRRLLTLAIAALAGLLLWWIIDQWIWSPGIIGRTVLLSSAVVAVVIYVAVRLGPVSRLRVRPDYAARCLERDHPELGHSLSSYVGLKDRAALSSHSVQVNAGVSLSDRVIESIGAEAARKLRSIDVPPSEATGLMPWWATTIGLIAALAIYSVASPKSILQSTARIFQPLADLRAPQRVQITDVLPGDAEVLAGQTLRVSASVTRLRDGEAAYFVWSSTESTTDPNERVALLPDGNGSLNQYFAEIEIPHHDSGIKRYRIEAGDASAGPFELSIRDTPVVRVAEVHYDPPSYTGQKPRVRRNGAISAVEGTQVRIVADVNRPVTRAILELNPRLRGQEVQATAGASEMKLIDGGIRVEHEMRLRPRRGNATVAIEDYRIRVWDDAGQTNADPVIYPIEVIEDLPPEIAIVVPQRSPVDVPIDSVQRFEIHASDVDFGLSEVEVEVRRGIDVIARSTVWQPDQVDGQPLANVLGNQVVEYRFRPSRMITLGRGGRLNVGDEVEVVAIATDNRTADLAKTTRPGADPDPGVTRTPPVRLKITMPENPNTKPEQPQDEQQTKKPQDQPSKSGEKGQGESGQQGGGQGSQADSSEQGKGSGSEGSGTENSGTEGSGDENSNKGESNEGGSGMNDSKTDSPSEGNNSKDSGSGDSANDSGSAKPSESPSGEEASNDENSSSADAGKSGNQATGGQERGGQESGGKGNASGKTGDPSKGEATGKAGDANQNDSARQDGSAAKGDSSSKGDTQNGETQRPPQDDAEAFERIQEFLEKQKQRQDSNQNQPNQSEGRSDSDGGDRGNREGGNQAGEQARDQSQPGSESQSGKESQPGKESQSGSKSQPGSESQSRDPSKPQGRPQSQKDSTEPRGDSAKGETAAESDLGNQPTGNPEDGNPEDGKSDDGTSNESADDQSGDPSQTSPNGSKAKPQTSGTSPSGQPEGGQPEGVKSDGGKSPNQQPKGEPTESETSEGNQMDSAQSDSGQSDSAQSDSTQSDSTQSDSTQSDSGQSPSDRSKAGPSQAGQSESDRSDGGPSEGGPSESGVDSQTRSEADASSPADPRQSEGGGKGSSGAGSGQDDPGDEAELPDPVDMEYTQKATDMVLDYLDETREAPDPELLDRLNWSEQDLRQFQDRWKDLQPKNQESSSPGELNQDLREALRSLGMRPPGDTRRTQRDSADEVRGLRDSGNRREAPPSVRDAFEAFRRGLSR
ncbi:hypothetical protein Pla100_62530 [Neorhodopirellula pilleata]|uniref:Circumsporozoite protein-putative membrane associated protein n=1 Tax=Neorhodopirellula pilleata TaxID=2714738 RepID=A0A5C5ZF89_9BACT|nr:hypothetical protein Pla100_62530 [Neorhodopirellula pilleata]